MQLRTYADTTGELIFLAAAQLLVGEQPIISGTLESCLENWTLLPAAARSSASILVTRPIRFRDEWVRHLAAEMIADVARRYRITAPRQRSIDRTARGDGADEETGHPGL